MSLETKLFATVAVIGISAATMFGIRSGKSFYQANYYEMLAYASAVLGVTIGVGWFHWAYRKIRYQNNEQPGHFGIPDSAIREMEKRDSGRYRRI